MAKSIEVLEELLRQKHYRGVITYLKQVKHPIINDLEHHIEVKNTDIPTHLKIEHIQLSDEDIDALIHEMQTIRLEKQLQLSVNLIVGVGAILIGTWGIYSTLISDFSRAYFIVALPIGLLILYFAFSSK